MYDEIYKIEDMIDVLESLSQLYFDRHKKEAEEKCPDLHLMGIYAGKHQAYKDVVQRLRKFAADN